MRRTLAKNTILVSTKVSVYRRTQVLFANVETTTMREHFAKKVNNVSKSIFFSSSIRFLKVQYITLLVILSINFGIKLIKLRGKKNFKWHSNRKNKILVFLEKFIARSYFIYYNLFFEFNDFNTKNILKYVY